MATMAVTLCTMVGVATSLLALLRFGPVLAADVVAENGFGLREEDSDFQNGCTEENLPNYIDKITLRLTHDTQELYLTGVVVLTERMLPGTDMVVTVSKCLTHDDVRSCTRYSVFPYEDMCAKLKAKDRFWTPLVESMQQDGFNPECPTNTGNFSVQDVLIDLSEDLVDTRTNFGLGYWRMHLEILNGDKNHFCVDALSEIKRLRRPRKKPAQH